MKLGGRDASEVIEVGPEAKRRGAVKLGGRDAAEVIEVGPEAKRRGAVKLSFVEAAAPAVEKPRR